MIRFAQLVILCTTPTEAFARYYREEGDGAGAIGAAILTAVFAFVYFKERSRDAGIGMAACGIATILIIAAGGMSTEAQWLLIGAGILGFWAYSKFKSSDHDEDLGP